MDMQKILKVDRNRPIYIFGASSAGRLAKEALVQKNFSNVAGFIDSYRNGQLDGLPIIKFDDFLEEYDSEFFIIIASSFYVELEIKLSANGIFEYLII